MARTRTTSLVLALFMAPLMALFVSACAGGGGEQALIRSYFLAARLNDRPTLNNIAMVRFDPREDGSVSGVSVVSVTEQQTRPLRIKELNEALADAQQADEDFNTEKVAYQDENFDAINRVLAAERDEDDVARRDVEVQEAWTDWRNQTMEHAKTVSDAQVALTREQNSAALSMFDPNEPLDLTQYDGELLTKEVSITADVELNGAENERSMVVTLQQAVMTGSDGTVIEGAWVIANIS
ncbi:MAG: hypothetical protein QGI10_16830 [Vicinamibacterales bacterium]|nr:hypothetical protein [Vicinamibacterales bacterium]HJN44359.1 hypothetical protein [Vicinamibacterales bacterium]|tara:strand:+ start:406 stop:1122 length:717 start_codon:yes stop_codon:yes gene_type:complete